MAKKIDIDSRVSRILEAYNEISRCINPGNLIRLDLTSSQVKVLMLFSVSDGATMTELSLAQTVSVSTMTSMVDRLIHGGFLERRKDESDRRIVRVFLTVEGKKTVSHLVRVRKKALEKFYLGLSGREREQFVRSIENVAHYLQTAKSGELFA